MRPSASQFQIGDLVAAAVNYPQRNHSILKDTEGVVCDIDDWPGGISQPGTGQSVPGCYIEDNMIGVDWGFEVDGGHGCNGNCTYGHGWYAESKEIKLCDAGQDIDEDSFLQVIGGMK